MELHLFVFAALVAMATGRVCPDGSLCEILETCCDMDVGWGCCPLPWAECCLDKLHCCPHGYVCDTTDGLCFRGATESIPWIEKVKSHKPSYRLVSKVDTGKRCPAGNQTCPDSYTCCEMPLGSYGCCPLKDAVCCADNLHCCPAGSKCDTADGICIMDKSHKKKDHYSARLSLELKHTEEDPIICPNGKDRCEEDETCCVMKSGRYGCCSYPQATCCSDKETCCPHNTECAADYTCVPKKKTMPYPFSAGIHGLPNDIPV